MNVYNKKMEKTSNEKVPFSKVITPDNPQSFEEKFPWDECVISSVCINQILSNSDLKFATLMCSFDAYYCDSDDTELTDPKVGPTRVEIVSIPIPQKKEENEFTPQKTEFIMSNLMNPVFSVTGPCSLTVDGYYTIDDSSEKSQIEAETDKNAEKNTENNEKTEKDKEKPKQEEKTENSTETAEVNENK